MQNTTTNTNSTATTTTTTTHNAVAATAAANVLPQLPLPPQSLLEARSPVGVLNDKVNHVQ